MASAFLLSANPSASTSSAFTMRPRSSTKSSFTYAAPRTFSQIPMIAEPQHNDHYIDGDAPFLSDGEVDLDVSFASNMSLSSAPNSPTARGFNLPNDVSSGSRLLPPQTRRGAPSSPVPMDISPAPKRIAHTVRVTSPTGRSSVKGLSGRALAQELFRGFGHDVANISNTSASSLLDVTSPTAYKSKRSTSPPRSKGRASASKGASNGRTRSALPMAWLQSPQHSPAPEPEKTPLPAPPKLGRNRSQTMIDPRHASLVGSEEQQQPAAAVAWDASISYDAMDIDGDVSISHSATAPSSPGEPLPTELNELFFQPSSPVLESSSPDVHSAKKRLSPEPEEFVEFDLEEEIAHAQQEELRRSGRAPSPDKPTLFSSSPPTSPSRPVRTGAGIGLGRPFERSATTGGQGSLFGSLGVQAPAILPKRNAAPRRPVLSAIIGDSSPSSTGSLPRSGALPPARRAFSACVTSSALMMGSPLMMDPGSDDSHGEIEGSPARAYATRKAAPPPRKMGVVASGKPNAPEPGSSKGNAPSQSSPLTRVGLPGFGDNEADGKVLPCQKVREDGLMRINCDTLDDLLAGAYNHEINSYTVIDCRFDYEYEGGHVPGAINLNTTQAIEDYLLGPNKPEPSRSGDGRKKDILVFHCEFSVKRAPTFAKHLRSRDRALNSHVYPNIHYPEVYIMTGGFCQYFKEKPSQVDPPYSYVTMDDPVHLRARHSDLNNFRKWERTKSYTYGEKQAAAAAIAQGQANAKRSTSASSQSSSNAKRSSAPSPTQSASIGRRMGHSKAHAASLSTLEEDGDSIYHSGENEGSPCPPSAANYLRPGLLGGKPRSIGRIALDRAASYGFATTKR